MHCKYENLQPRPPPNPKKPATSSSDFETSRFISSLDVENEPTIEPPGFGYVDRVRVNPRTRIGFLVAVLDYREWHGFLPFRTKKSMEEFLTDWLQVKAAHGELMSLVEELLVSAQAAARDVQVWSRFNDLDSQALDLACKVWKIKKETGDGKGEGKASTDPAEGNQEGRFNKRAKKVQAWPGTDGRVEGPDPFMLQDAFVKIFVKVWEGTLSLEEATEQIMEHIKGDPILELVYRFPNSLSISKVAKVLNILGCEKMAVIQAVDFLSISPMRRDVCAFRGISGCPRPQDKVLGRLENMEGTELKTYMELRAYLEGLCKAMSSFEED